jgi:hypothetical protein
MIEHFVFKRRLLASVRVAAMAIAALCGHGLHAQTPRAQELHAQQEWGDGPSFARPNSSPPINTGFLFIEGRYIPAPYVIEQDRESIRINGEVLREDEFDLSGYEEDIASRGGWPATGMMRMRRGMRRFGSSMRSRENSVMLPLQALSMELSNVRMGAVIVLFKQTQPLVLDATREGHELLQALCSVSTDPGESTSAPATLEAEFARQSWQRLVSEFEPTTEFLERASAIVNDQEAVFAENAAGIQASLWRERISFPLTIFAIVVVVLAFGHLLSNAPQLAGATGEPKSMQHARRVIVQSLVFVGLLSAVDLVWTLMAYQAGSMRELNPLGSGLIGDPSRLVMFKVSVTAAAIGLLYWLHQVPLAQRASWWCCLILTLLTARWLTFQSMFL